MQALKPLIQDCFHDDAERYPGEQSVALTFTVGGKGTRGTMARGEIARSSIPDPWAQACFQDSLLDARIPAPRGGSVTVTVAFRYVPRPR